MSCPGGPYVKIISLFFSVSMFKSLARRQEAISNTLKIDVNLQLTV